MPENIQLLHGDARHLPLPDESVQCIVTSPPYWGLRKYAGEQEIIWPAVAPNDGAMARLPAECAHEWGGADTATRKNQPGHFL